MSAFIAARSANFLRDGKIGLPKYAGELAAFHREFAGELGELVDQLPLCADMRVIDIGCGDGFYLPFLAEKLNARGAVIGLDPNQAYLNVARHVPALQDVRCRIDLVSGSLDDIPRHCCDCDLVWCAQCLCTFPDPISALRKMSSVLKPGGVLAVLENDTLHQLVLPWPPELEIAIRAAEFRSLQLEFEDPRKYYTGRNLPELFRQAGLLPLGFRTQSIDRQAPLGRDLVTFLRSYLERLARRVRPHLDPPLLERFEKQIDPESGHYLLDEDGFAMTWTNVIAWGQCS